MAQTYTPTAWTYAEIMKAEKQEDGSLRIYGRPTKEELDVDGQIADKKWVKEALPEWYKWANIREMHSPSAVGTGEKLEFDENDDPFIQARIIDPMAIKKVEEGVYKGLSIGIKDPIVKRDLEAPNGRICGGKIVEISLVDRPAVSSAKFDLVKMAGANEWLDCQTGFIIEKTAKPLDGDEVNPADFDDDGNPIQQPGHLKDDGDEPTIISQDATSVVVKVGDEVYRVPIDMDGQGNVIVGEPEQVPGTEPGEQASGKSTPDNDEDEDMKKSKTKGATSDAPNQDSPGEVGIEVDEKNKNASTEGAQTAEDMAIKAAIDAAMARKVLCQQCRKGVTIVKGAMATELAGGTRVSGFADCGHQVSAFVKSAETSKKDDKEADKTPMDNEKADEKGATPDDKGAEPDKKTEDKSADSTTESDDDKVEKAVLAVLKKFGVVKDAEPAEPQPSKHDKMISDLRTAYKTFGEVIEKAASAFSGKGADAAENPSRVHGTDPKEIIAELKDQITAMMTMINQGEDEMNHEEGETEPNLGENPVAPTSKPEGDGQINFTAGDMKSVVADAVKAALSVRSDKTASDDIAKSVGEAVKGVLEPVINRLEKVEHMSQPSPFIYEADRAYALNPETEQRTSAVKNVQAEMRKLSPKDQQRVMAAAIAKARGWS
ncbi:hypothetical protein [Alicyclobacillus fastidiosus]|uniref:Prohead protease n=1 Tax=Alicyclobacillus fastidiosus TaxID=392011 RepID=A0ABV5AN24_9BACL|nr:hypothetical protein [Alicyclobacillus fastidiosus]WEH08485.1 hypothetical protein PYS47_17585 [Alicyclobacillus fastidiosus]